MKNKLQKIFLIFTLPLGLWLFSAPLLSMLGALNMNAFSVFEFYQIDLILVPLNRISDKKKLSNLPMLSYLSIFNLTFLKSWLPEKFGTFVEKYANRIDIVIGDALSFVVNEILGLAMYLISWKCLLVVPLLSALFLSPFNILFLPISIPVFITTFSNLCILSLVASIFLNRAIYRYIRLEPLLFSIVFSVLTDNAFRLLHSGAANAFFATGFYALTLIPLAFFVYRAFNANIDEDSSFLTQLGTWVGRTSLLMHVIEALYLVLGMLGYKHCYDIALFLNSKPVQTSVLSVTTTVSALCVGEQLIDEKHQLIASAA